MIQLSAAVRKRIGSSSPLPAAAIIRLATSSRTRSALPTSRSPLQAASKASPTPQLPQAQTRPVPRRDRLAWPSPQKSRHKLDTRKGLVKDDPTALRIRRSLGLAQIEVPITTG